MIVIDRVVKPGFVYHAELISPLERRERATQAEIAQMYSCALEDDEHDEIRDLYYEELARSMPRSSSKNAMPNLQMQRFRARDTEHDPLDGANVRNCKDRSTRITGALIVTWRLFNKTGSLSTTARALGISPQTVRDRIISLKLKVLRAQGIELGTVAQNRNGRLCAPGRGRPTNEEIAQRKLAKAA